MSRTATLTMRYTFRLRSMSKDCKCLSINLEMKVW